MEGKYISVVSILLNTSDAHQMNDVKLFLETSGFTDITINEERGLIEATGETDMVDALDRSHLFCYMRTNFKYWSCCPDTDCSDEPV